MDRISHDGDPGARDALFFQLTRRKSTPSPSRPSPPCATSAGRRKIEEASCEHDRMKAILEELKHVRNRRRGWPSCA
jgi:hypothetical protein